jgi:hypothetical protein
MKRRSLLFLVLFLLVAAVGIAAAQLPPPPTPIHDVAVSVSVFPPVAAPGDTVEVSGTVWNKGNVDEFVRVTVGTRLGRKNRTRSITLYLPLEGQVTGAKEFKVPVKAPAGLYPVAAVVQILGDATDSHPADNADETRLRVSP